jgi:hypothetical protein
MNECIMHACIISYIMTQSIRKEATKQVVMPTNQVVVPTNQVVVPTNQVVVLRANVKKGRWQQC